ncbi:Uncharacterized protein M6B38_217990 [Iris pallida]|uniref:TFIIS N-terminal domain-containing protein n=1 Tax=Iris pallida TaxID=29817 RepID=A0AAX6E0W2_IRIPA|nr:Uncharacterized protein M6B38_217990 [Iris pallida]
MTSSSSGSLDYWRKLFRSAGTDIFQVLESAIDVAAADRLEDFLLRRDRIAERLFTLRLDRCLRCNRVREQPTAAAREEEDDDGKLEEKESKVDSNSHGDFDVDVDVVDPVRNSNYSYDEAEALTEEMEEESQLVGEVLRIKNILDHHQEESDRVLFDSLRRLQLMALSIDTLKATDIGRAVNRLRKHSSNEIRQLARMLIDGWKLLVDEWLKVAPSITDNSPVSVNPSVLDEEEGLPSPPLDEGALFSTQTASIQLSQFFDGMDDDGNLRNEGAFDKKHESERRPLENCKLAVRKQQQPSSQFNIPEPKEQRRGEPKLLEAPNSQSKPQGIILKSKLSSTDSGPGRPARLVSEQKGISYMNPRIQKNTNAPQEKKNSEDVSVLAKLEVSKRKLQERYQEAENAKRQRTTQVMELHDLPKQGHLHNNNKFSSSVKHKSNIRNVASSRR